MPNPNHPITQFKSMWLPLNHAHILRRTMRHNLLRIELRHFSQSLCSKNFPHDRSQHSYTFRRCFARYNKSPYVVASVVF